jgi:hypothetical protein
MPNLLQANGCSPDLPLAVTGFPPLDGTPPVQDRYAGQLVNASNQAIYSGVAAKAEGAGASRQHITYKEPRAQALHLRSLPPRPQSSRGLHPPVKPSDASKAIPGNGKKDATSISDLNSFKQKLDKLAQLMQNQGELKQAIKELEKLKQPMQELENIEQFTQELKNINLSVQNMLFLSGKEILNLAGKVNLLPEADQTVAFIDLLDCGVEFDLRISEKIIRCVNGANTSSPVHTAQSHH